MPTPKELRLQAEECLELADKANEFYVRTALKELAQKLHRDELCGRLGDEVDQAAR